MASDDLTNSSWASGELTEELQSTLGNIQTKEARVPVGSAQRRFLRLNVRQLPP